MRSFIFTTLFLSLTSFNLFAQTTDPIIVGWSGIKMTYQQNGEYLNHDQLVGLLKSKPESESECIQSEKQGMVFGILAIPAVVFVVVDRLYNWIWIPVTINGDGYKGKSDQAQKTEAIIGLSVMGLASIGIPFLVSSNVHLHKSIHNYNNARITGKMEDIKINVGLIGNGVGVQIRF